MSTTYINVCGREGGGVYEWNAAHINKTQQIGDIKMNEYLEGKICMIHGVV